MTASSVIVADDENLEIAEEYGFDRLEFPNDKGLGAKFNAGFQYALDKGADYVVHVGSDNWVHPDFFDPLPLSGNSILCSASIAVVYVPTGEAVLSCLDREDEWGAIPWAIPQSMFVGVEHPIDPQLESGVEWSLIQNLGEILWRKRPKHDYLAVDWKTDINISRFHSLLNVFPVDDFWEQLASYYPSWLVEKARQLRRD